MDIESYKALSQVIVHDTLSVVKQLQKELAKEKRAHKLIAHKHESLLEMIDQDFHEEVGPVTFCAGCGSALNIRYGDFPTIFTFKRNKAGVLKIEGLGVCHDCDYENLSIDQRRRRLRLPPRDRSSRTAKHSELDGTNGKREARGKNAAVHQRFGAQLSKRLCTSSSLC